MARASIRDDVTALLQQLIRVDTVNPPGNETAAAELLRAYLEPLGVECSLHARQPERANLVARLRGRDPGAPRLLFLSHTDTVVAEPAEWAVPPWSGELRDGEVWGRGALDMKGHAAAAAVALAVLAREGFEPDGDVIFAATADEEVGDGFGLPWLCEAHPEAVRATWCINEGGGDRIELGGRAIYLCATSEKASAPFRLRVRGRGGHASTPAIGDSALVKAARLVERLAELRLPATLTPETQALVTALLPASPPEQALERLAADAPRAAAMIEPMLRTTVSPTQIVASTRRNVIPAVCEITCDCRLLPGVAPTDVEAELVAQLGPDGYELEWIEHVGGSRSSLDTPLWAAVEGFVQQDEPGAAVVPILLPGFTDSHYLRQAFGTIAYGFFPMRAMDAELAALLVHSADERVAVDDLELGTRFLIHVARTLTG
jgi:acetylornithine deacetylase/succinyl-diaminopimelate desuccinylase-like protein